MNAIYPNWRVSDNVHAFTTTRQNGVSLVPFDSFNLGDHVGDEQNSVKTNRTLLIERFRLPQFPQYLTQTHSTRVIKLPYFGHDLEADAVYTDQPKQVCLVMTADCLPVLFCSKAGNEVAAAHAGWRGLCDGILEATIRHFQCPPEEIIAWFGPAIGKMAFQVGREVAERFIAVDAQATWAFKRDPHTREEKYLGDLYQIAAQRLNNLGVTRISGGEHCTYRENELFFSYRRDGKTGRMASLIWFE
ncbi:peptidoglycan editing factor PgeF [Pasteurellaceae bacterium LIM206]|nr:peptidoglycan editing factor PgeF [Pasteurellaceae bacterium LIM206]